MTDYQAWNLFWSAIAALAATGTLIVVTTAALFAYRQVREVRRARELHSALAVIEHVSSPAIRNARRLVYDSSEEICALAAAKPDWDTLDSNFRDLSSQRVDFTDFHSYLASLENVAMLVLHDIAPDNVVQMYLGRMAPDHWQRIGPFIRFLRERYGSDDFLQHFEMLTKLLAADGLRLRGSLRRPTSVKTLWRSCTHYSLRMKRRLLRERLEARARDDAARVTSSKYHHTEGKNR